MPFYSSIFSYTIPSFSQMQESYTANMQHIHKFIRETQMLPENLTRHPGAEWCCCLNFQSTYFQVQSLFHPQAHLINHLITHLSHCAVTVVQHQGRDRERFRVWGWAGGVARAAALQAVGEELLRINYQMVWEFTVIMIVLNFCLLYISSSKTSALWSNYLCKHLQRAKVYRDNYTQEMAVVAKLTPHTSSVKSAHDFGAGGH